MTDDVLTAVCLTVAYSNNSVQNFTSTPRPRPLTHTNKLTLSHESYFQREHYFIPQTINPKPSLQYRHSDKKVLVYGCDIVIIFIVKETNWSQTHLLELVSEFLNFYSFTGSVVISELTGQVCRTRLFM